jgi:hypothetical protein
MEKGVSLMGAMEVKLCVEQLHYLGIGSSPVLPTK